MTAPRFRKFVLSAVLGLIALHAPLAFLSFVPSAFADGEDLSNQNNSNDDNSSNTGGDPQPPPPPPITSADDDDDDDDGKKRILAIDSPAPGQAVSGVFQVVGTAAGSEFLNYRVDIGPGTDPAGAGWILGPGSGVPVVGGVLHTIDSRNLPNGVYTIRLYLTDIKVHSHERKVTVSVNNPLPPLQPPASFAGVPTGPTSILWSWSDTVGEQVYQVQNEAGVPVSGNLPGETVAWTEPNLTPGVPYTRRVVAFRDAEAAPTGFIVVATPALPPPPVALQAPATFVGQPVDYSAIQWSWSDVPDETSFQVLNELGINISGDLPANTVAWQETGLTPGITYTRYIRAVRLAETATSAPAAVAAPLATRAPDGFAGAAQSDSAIAWSWTDVENEIGFRVEDTAGAGVSGNLPPNTLTWVETNLAPNTAYVRRVTSFDALKAYPGGFVQKLTLARPPLGLTAQSFTAQSIQAVWSPNGNPDGTQYIATLSLGGQKAAEKSAAATNATFTGLQSGATYTVTVAAVNGEGVPSAPVSVQVVAGSPELPPPPPGSTVVEQSLSFGLVKLEIPPGAFPAGTTLSVREATSFPSADAGADALKPAGLGFEITASSNTHPAVPVRLTVIYLSQRVSGFQEARLVVARHDGAAGWTTLHGNASPAAHRLTADIDHFSLFQIMQKPDLTKVRVYPNPYRPSLGHSAILFESLPANAAIKIFSLMGELVREFSADGGGRAAWDVTNGAGRDVSSGVYFVVLDGGGKKFKVVVQR